MEQLYSQRRVAFLFRTIAFTVYYHRVWYSWKLELIRSKYSTLWQNQNTPLHGRMTFLQTWNINMTSKNSVFLYFIVWNLLCVMDLKFWVLVLSHPYFVEFCSKVLKLYIFCCLSHFNFHITVSPKKVVQWRPLCNSTKFW